MAKGRRAKNGGSEDPQVELLRAIWTEMKALNSRVDKTNERLDTTNERLDAVRTELKDELTHVRTELKDEITEVKHGVDMLGRRMIESEVRLATATTQLAADVQTLSGLVRDWREEHRSDRAELRDRVARLEQHTGIAPTR